MALFLLFAAAPFMLCAEQVAIIDAGSSGSRLFVYDIDATRAVPVKLVYPIGAEQKALSRGRPLSSIANHTDSVKVFLQNITANYPCDSIPLYVLATAGMRLKPKAQADSIYAHLMAQPCLNGYVVKGAMTISGQYEGLYGWLAANYDNGKIGFNSESQQRELTYLSPSYGILEIGGASMQIAFATEAASSQTLYRPGLGNIFCKSYLGAGVDQIYQHTQSGCGYKFHYDYGTDYSGLYTNKTFWGLGIPVNLVLEGIEKQSGKSYRRKTKAYIKSMASVVDSWENYHPRMNAHYIPWALRRLHLEEKVAQPEKDASWTVGAALDIAVNGKEPEGFEHDRPN